MPDWKSNEICEVADMIAIALKLSAAGLGDYWGRCRALDAQQFPKASLIHDSPWSVPAR